MSDYDYDYHDNGNGPAYDMFTPQELDDWFGDDDCGYDNKYDNSGWDDRETCYGDDDTYYGDDDYGYDNSEADYVDADPAAVPDAPPSDDIPPVAQE